MTDHPKIKLAGVEYEIPPLAIKQNKYVEPIAARHLDYFNEVVNNKGIVTLRDLTPERSDDFTRIVYYAVTRAKPDLAYAQFEDMNITMREIMDALWLCLKQSGLFRPATEAPPPTGEDGKPSTGMA